MNPRRFVRLAILILCIPIAAFADNSVDFGMVGGTLSGGSSGFPLAGSTLVSVNGLSGGALITSDNLGSVSFTTDALSSSVQAGSTHATSGTFMVSDSGRTGVHAGTAFSGTFRGPVTWTMVTLANGTHNYTIMGGLPRTLPGISTSGVTAQLSINPGKEFFDSSTLISSGDTRLENLTVPEPGTLILLGTGLLGLAGSLRWTKKL